MINYGRHFIDQKDIQAVKKVLKSKFLTQGPFVKKFETNLKRKFKSKYCITTTSATSALFLVGKALNWNKQTNVACPAMSFLASSNSILFHSAKPIFVDISLKDYCIDPSLLERAIKKNKKIKFVIITDYAGHPANWIELRKLANKYKLLLINDNCHSIGSKIKNNIGYASKYADIVVHSYHPVKTITTGEGGAIFVKDKSIYKKILFLKNHYMKKKLSKYDVEVDDLGYNFRMSDINASLGSEQLKKLDKFVNKRRYIAHFYNKIFSDIKGITIPPENKNFYHSYHLYPILIDFKKYKISRLEFLRKLKKKKINLQIHYKPAYRFNLYKSHKLIEYRNSELFYSKTISLPIYFSLKKNDLKFIVKCIKEILKIT